MVRHKIFRYASYYYRIEEDARVYPNGSSTTMRTKKLDSSHRSIE